LVKPLSLYSLFYLILSMDCPAFTKRVYNYCT